MLKALFSILLLTTPGIRLSPSELGVAGASLSATPTTRSIDMELVMGGISTPTNQLALTLNIVPGSSTAVQVACYESNDSSTWAKIALCDSATPVSACAPDVRSFTLASYPTVGSSKYIVTRWSVKQRYIKCSFYDAGTGTVTVTGTRSWQ